MSAVRIHYTTKYIKDFKKLNSDLAQTANEKENIFKTNPYSPVLKTHKLSGKLQNYWAFSITYKDRVLFKFITNKEVIFYKIGSHDIYK